MVALRTLKPGDVVFDTARTKMGNTTMSTLSCWRVRIVEVHPDHVVASWNGNPAKAYRAWAIKRWTRTPPKGTGEREAWDRRRAALAQPSDALKDNSEP